MVRILTAHRVFPAKVTGGNGIAGTSVVPGYYLNNTLRAARAAMTFLGHAKLYRTKGLSRFRRSCGGRPRPLRGGARAVRPAGCDWDSRRGTLLRPHKIRLPSKERSSLRNPSFRSISLPGYYDAARGVGCGKNLRRLLGDEFGGLSWAGKNDYTLRYGFGSIRPRARRRSPRSG
jgi:hypothetical protein